MGPPDVPGSASERTGEAEATPGTPGAPAGALRALLGRVPSGVAVVTVDAGGQRLGLTVGTVVGLSLEPPLVGFAVSGQAALHELLREAGACTISLLAAGQEALAEHFARGVPPIGMWQGIEIQTSGGPPRLSGALGWVECTLRDEVRAGTHTFFICAVEGVDAGVDAQALARVRGGFTPA